MIYKFVTKKQKKFLDKTCFALGITLDELMEVQDISILKSNIKTLSKNINELKNAIEERDKTILDLTSIVTQLQVDIQNMQNEAMLMELSNERK